MVQTRLIQDRPSPGTNGVSPRGEVTPGVRCAHPRAWRLLCCYQNSPRVARRISLPPPAGAEFRDCCRARTAISNGGNAAPAPGGTAMSDEDTQEERFGRIQR